MNQKTLHYFLRSLSIIQILLALVLIKDYPIISAALTAGIWGTTYKANFAYSKPLDLTLYILGFFFSGFIFDQIFQTTFLFTLASGFLFVSAGGIRNSMPFMVGHYHFIWLERITYFFVLIFYGFALYHQNFRYEMIFLAAPAFVFATVYTWQVRFQEIKAYHGLSKSNGPLKPGDQAIPFSLKDQKGNIVSLQDFKDKHDVLILFVRGDWCPACHIMLRTYYVNRQKFIDRNVFFLAIGPDDFGVNKEMLERLGVDFTILSDPDLKITGMYGVQGDGKTPGYNQGIPLPAAFVVDKNLKIRFSTRPESPGSFLKPDAILPVLDGLEVTENNETFEETYETIVNQANDAIAVINIINGELLQSNLQFAHLLNYSLSDLNGKKIFDLTPQTFLEESAKLIANAWENKGAIFRMPFVSKNMEEIPTECSAKVIPFGKNSALVLYIRDIRERLKMENEIREKNAIIEQKNRDIMDSIEYAKRIQFATLPDNKQFSSFTKNFYIDYQPRDVVSGDFYWVNFEQDKGLVFFALGDCTGHGVPGAFMSMLCTNLLNHIIDDQHIIETTEIFKSLDANIRKALKQEDGGGQDGMDCALAKWHESSRTLELMLAGRPAWLIYPEANEITEIKANKFPIGGTFYMEKSFESTILNIPIGTKLMFFSDGIVDQMGGESGKKIGSKRLKQWITEKIHHKTEDIGQYLSKNINEWKATHHQLDDMSFILYEF